MLSSRRDFLKTSIQGASLIALAPTVPGFLSFFDALTEVKLADRVVVLCFSEFGRRVQENVSRGTDHGTAGPVFLAGPAVQPGLIGTYPSLTDLDGGDLKMTVDFRRVYASVLEKWPGLPLSKPLNGSFEPLPLFRV